MPSKTIVKPKENTTLSARIVIAAEQIIAAGKTWNAETLKEEARNPNHILHTEYRWDEDSVLAEERRLQIAGYHIRLVVVQRKTIKGEVRIVRKYHLLPSAKAAGTGYEEIDAIMEDNDKRAELLQMAIDEIDSFINRYDTLAELAMVIEPMQKIIKYYKKEDRSNKVIG